ncbi:MAG: hypothetical protein GQ564_14350 [Bacteroidales bacterium]|nr:hypothetical protein [Bacteroidales bacterium]
MKYLLIVLSFLILDISSFSQNKNQIVQSYFDLTEKDNFSQLHHGPVLASCTNQKQTTVFFVSTLDTITDEFYVQGVLYNHQSESYTEFGQFDFDPSFGKGVISVFFENVDYDSENEMLVIVEKSCRTFFTDGGYAGIKAWYQTRVFDFNAVNEVIVEYELLGEILTINAPKKMGTKIEEELIGRESGKDLNEILGITNNAEAIRKRIKYLKSKSLLGSNKPN